MVTSRFNEILGLRFACIGNPHHHSYCYERRRSIWLVIVAHVTGATRNKNKNALTRCKKRQTQSARNRAL